MNLFGTDNALGRRYEVWEPREARQPIAGAENSFVMFYPRWVGKGPENRTYVFDYEWTFCN